MRRALRALRCTTEIMWDATDFDMRSIAPLNSNDSADTLISNDHITDNYVARIHTHRFGTFQEKNWGIQ